MHSIKRLGAYSRSATGRAHFAHGLSLDARQRLTGGSELKKFLKAIFGNRVRESRGDLSLRRGPISENGLAASRPAMLGAEPCAACAMA